MHLGTIDTAYTETGRTDVNHAPDIFSLGVWDKRRPHYLAENHTIHIRQHILVIRTHSTHDKQRDTLQNTVNIALLRRMHHDTCNRQ